MDGIKERLDMHRIDAGIFQAGLQQGKIQTLQIVRIIRLDCIAWHPAKNTDRPATDKPISDNIELSAISHAFVLACLHKNSTLKKIYAKTH